MRSILAALLFAGALTGAAAALPLLPPFHAPAAAPTASEDDRMDMSMSEEGSGYQDPMAGAHDWHGGTGQIPTLAEAVTKLERRSSITIGNDSQFNPANGVRSGAGTFDDPFVISGWYVDTVIVHDTTKAFEFKDNYVASILIVDWTGQGGYVHHDHLENLRTNRNVQRVGDPSATVIENNEIVRVEQLRHFDGEVRSNVIGVAASDALSKLDASGLLRAVESTVQPQVVFDIAGLNGAGIHDNVIHGGVDMKLHGHHHSDHAGGASHNHGQAESATMEAMHDHHAVRYVDFEFYANTIDDPSGFGLRYNDLNHAGDDRTATSEQEPDLDLPHVHHTRVAIHDNHVSGGSLRIAVLNSPDDHHLPGESAYLVLANNTVSLPNVGDGIVLQDVRDATVLIQGNTVDRANTQLAGGAAISMLRFWNATILVGPNDLGAFQYGIKASHFDERTRWTVLPQTEDGAKTPVYWDSSVANPPS